MTDLPPQGAAIPFTFSEHFACTITNKDGQKSAALRATHPKTGETISIILSGVFGQADHGGRTARGQTTPSKRIGLFAKHDCKYYIKQGDDPRHKTVEYTAAFQKIVSDINESFAP